MGSCFVYANISRRHRRRRKSQNKGRIVDKARYLEIFALFCVFEINLLTRHSHQKGEHISDAWWACICKLSLSPTTKRFSFRLFPLGAWWLTALGRSARCRDWLIRFIETFALDAKLDICVNDDNSCSLWCNLNAWNLIKFNFPLVSFRFFLFSLCIELTTHQRRRKIFKLNFSHPILTILDSSPTFYLNCCLIGWMKLT